MKASTFQQIELCKSCEFWEGTEYLSGWCYMFEQIPEYKCMCREARDGHQA